MFDLTELLPYEKSRKSGAWCDIWHAVTGDRIGRIRVLPLNGLAMQVAINERTTSGLSPIDAVRDAFAHVGVVEADQISIRGEAVCDKRELLVEMVAGYEFIYTQILAFANNPESYALGESMPHAIGPDAQDSQRHDG